MDVPRRVGALATDAARPTGATDVSLAAAAASMRRAVPGMHAVPLLRHRGVHLPQAARPMVCAVPLRTRRLPTLRDRHLPAHRHVGLPRVVAVAAAAALAALAAATAEAGGAPDGMRLPLGRLLGLRLAAAHATAQPVAYAPRHRQPPTPHPGRSRALPYPPRMPAPWCVSVGTV